MKGYNQQCDVWSMGVIVYILLCGFPPFYADNDAQLFEKIKRGQYEFLKPYWDPISDAAKAFVRRMLVVDPTKRATCEELLNDPWLEEIRKADPDAGVAEQLAAGANLSTSAQLPTAHEKLKKLKGAFLATWAAVAMSEAAAQ